MLSWSCRIKLAKPTNIREASWLWEVHGGDVPGALRGCRGALSCQENKEGSPPQGRVGREECWQGSSTYHGWSRVCQVCTHLLLIPRPCGWVLAGVHQRQVPVLVTALSTECFLGCDVRDLSLWHKGACPCSAMKHILLVVNGWPLRSFQLSPGILGLDRVLFYFGSFAKKLKGK